jgi:stearoyl-CoA desaturase (delta-9 desaturase)
MFLVSRSCQSPPDSSLGHFFQDIRRKRFLMNALGDVVHKSLPAAARASHEAQRLQRRIALWVVIVPFLALLVGIVLLSRSAVGRIELLLLLGFYWASHIGAGLGFHRYFSHRSFQTTKWFRGLLAILGSMAAQGPVVQWAAAHRRHHNFSDHQGDPHSPLLHGTGVLNTLRGLWHAHMGWLFEPQVYDWVLYVPDLVKDRMLMKLNRLYFLWVFLGLALPSLLGYWLIGGWRGALDGLLWGGLIRIALGHHSVWSVNSLCHIIGTRPYRSNDNSRNNPFLAIAVFGDGWHNNHHAFPTSAFHGLEWWEIDLHGYLLRSLALFGLAWDIKRPSRNALDQKLRSKSDVPVAA